MTPKDIAKIKKIVKDCRQSPSFFIESFCKVKHPNAGILPFKLFSYQKKCLECFLRHRFNIFNKTRQCFAAGSMVWTPNGPIPIEQIKPNDEVYTYNIVSNTIEVATVKQVYSNVRDTVVAKTRNGHSVVVTPDHKYLTSNGWIELSRLSHDDDLIEVNDIIGSEEIDLHTIILLAYIITKGEYDDGSIIITCKDKRHIYELYSCYANTSNQQKITYKYLNDCVVYRININESYEWTKALANNQLPASVFKWNNKSLLILINSILQNSMKYITNDTIVIKHKSIILLNQLKQLLTRFNIKSMVDQTHNTIIIKDCNNIDFSTISIKDDYMCKSKKQTDKILSVVKNKPIIVYDLEVPPHNNFIIDGVVVHNSGISTLCGTYALWLSMFFKNKTILIVSKRDLDAKEFLARNVKFVYRYLPQWMKSIWQTTIDNEHQLGFANGSKITSLPSGPDTLRANSSSLNIIDESAFCPHMDDMWAGGYPCCRGDTLIQTSEGLIKIENLANKNGKQWQDININVATDNGFKNSNFYYISGPRNTIIVNTHFGFEFEGTKHHKVRIIDDNGNYIWRRLDNLHAGDIIVTMPGQFCGKRRILANGTELTPELSETIGLYVGTKDAQKTKFDIEINLDDDKHINDIIHKLNNDKNTESILYQKDDINNKLLTINVEKLTNLLIHNNININDNNIEIPELILQSDKPVLCAFLHGIFNASGWYEQIDDTLYIGFTFTSQKLSEQIQVALHSLGILSKRAKILNDDPRWEMIIYGLESKKKFIDIISFKPLERYLDDSTSITSRMLINHPVLVQEFIDELHNRMAYNDDRIIGLLRLKEFGKTDINIVKKLSNEFNTQDRLSKYVDLGYNFDTVDTIKDGYIETYDISVPSNNTYLANGIISHNTLQHGGSVIVVSTSNGVGDWYWRTWTDALEKRNEFNPISIDWWEMDWTIEYIDDVSHERVIISPTYNMKKCTTKEEKNKYGEYWSQWLETQYRQLTEKGNDAKFRQEVLREFLKSGNTVLSKDTITTIKSQIKEHKTYKTVNQVDYINPITSESYILEFDDRLWIWNEPIIDHIYSLGADISSGESNDWSAIEIFDITAGEQVAELQIKTKPKTLAIMIDYLGRLYNNAFVVPERTGMGVTVCQELGDLSYPNLFRKNMLQIGNTKISTNIYSSSIGFNTTGVGKPIINKALIDNLGENGYVIKSHRLAIQFESYVYLNTVRTGADRNAQNDDLVIATGLAFVGANLAMNRSTISPLPFLSSSKDNVKTMDQDIQTNNDFRIISPVSLNQQTDDITNDELQKFSRSLIVPISDTQIATISSPKKYFDGSKIKK